MKKIIYTMCAMALLFSAKAQVSVSEDNNIKNFRFGLKGALSVDWMSPDNEKKFQSNGAGVGYGWGAQMEFRLNSVTSISTGFGLYTNVGGLDFLSASSADSAYYLLNQDEEFVAFSDSATNAGFDSYLLKSRNYKINYVSIPFAVKMKTKEIGYLTYFGEFGANIGVKTKTRVNDEVYVNGSSSVSEVKDLDLDAGTQPVRLGLLVGGGAEYNFSGSTSMFFGLHYNHFFTNALKKEDPYLREDINASTGQGTAITQKAIPGSISLTVGILF